MDGESSLAQPQLHVLGVRDHARLLSPDVFITIIDIDRLSLVCLLMNMCHILANEKEEVSI